MLNRIISGAQTGVDRGALDAALELGFPCGGWCPHDRRAEDGLIPERYPVKAVAAGGYRQRSIKNVADSDGTIIIHCGPPEGGTAQTVLHCVRQGKPHLTVDGDVLAPQEAARAVMAFIIQHDIATLNVAGPRASKAARGHGYTAELLKLVISSC